MKTKFIHLLFITGLITCFTSCKGEKKNETEATAAEAVKEAPIAAIHYAVDTTTSAIEWTGKKPTGQHTGIIKLKNGTITTKEGSVESGTFTIDMNSITVTDLEGDQKAGLEGHLKGLGKEDGKDHFFNVGKYPTAAFEITAISQKESKTYIQGNLTIKGIKKNISFPATRYMNRDTMSLQSEVFTINRTDWGVNYGSKSIFDNLGDKFINDDIELKIMLNAKKS